MNILVGCETSGEVREAFRDLDHVAYSCDLLPSDTGSPHHVVGDIMDVLQDPGSFPELPASWDIVIIHPPCTALCVSGNRYYGRGKPKHHLRLEAQKFTMELWDTAVQVCDRVAMENPVGVIPKKATQYIQPWQFGHGETKKTGLWLHGLPELVPTKVVEGREQRVWKMPPSPDRWKMRSKTYRGIAQAMAEQWTGA